jgi:hypothetical protein
VEPKAAASASSIPSLPSRSAHVAGGTPSRRVGLPLGSAASAAASPWAVALPSALTNTAAAAAPAPGLLLCRMWLYRGGQPYWKMPPPGAASAPSRALPGGACDGLPASGLLLGLAKRLGRNANSPKSSPAHDALRRGSFSRLTARPALPRSRLRVALGPARRVGLDTASPRFMGLREGPMVGVSSGVAELLPPSGSPGTAVQRTRYVWRRAMYSCADKGGARLAAQAKLRLVGDGQMLGAQHPPQHT